MHKRFASFPIFKFKKRCNRCCNVGERFSYPDIYTAGTLQVWYVYIGDLAIYNAKTGNIIDVNAFSGGGLSQVYHVEADTASHEKLVVIAEGEIEAYADIENDGDPSNDKLISSAGFHQETVYTISELPSNVPE